MFDSDKSYEEKSNKDGGGGCNSKRVIKSFTEKVTFESDGMDERAGDSREIRTLTWKPGRTVRS